MTVGCKVLHTSSTDKSVNAGDTFSFCIWCGAIVDHMDLVSYEKHLLSGTIGDMLVAHTVSKEKLFTDLAVSEEEDPSEATSHMQQFRERSVNVRSYLYVAPCAY